MPLVINSLGGRHTNTHTDIRAETILRNRAHAGLWPVRVLFKNTNLSRTSLKLETSG